MHTVLDAAVVKAKMTFERMDGSQYEVDINPLIQFEFQQGCSDRCGRYDNEATLTIRGHITSTTIVPTKPAKPAPKPKKPTVRASAARVHKAATAQAKLLKRISIAEATLRVAKMQKEQLDVEIKTAQEQLVAAAQ